MKLNTFCVTLCLFLSFIYSMKSHHVAKILFHFTSSLTLLSITTNGFPGNGIYTKRKG